MHICLMLALDPGEMASLRHLAEHGSIRALWLRLASSILRLLDCFFILIWVESELL